MGAYAPTIGKNIFKTLKISKQKFSIMSLVEKMASIHPN
jgi:hypothetical protein